MLEVTCYAPSREAAASFMEACGIAKLDPETNVFIPIAEVQITPSGANDQWEIGEIDGFHWNLRFFGQSEITLRKPEPEGGWLPEHDLFDRTYILELVEGRTGLIPGWVADPEDQVPPGYEAGECRAFDPGLIGSRANVFA